MKIKENENARILALFHQIRERQERDNEHTNYKDAPALNEMADLIRPYIGKPEQEDLTDIAAVCLFLGNRYREMMRGVYAAEFFTAAFCAAVASVKGTDEELEDRIGNSELDWSEAVAIGEIREDRYLLQNRIPEYYSQRNSNDLMIFMQYLGRNNMNYYRTEDAFVFGEPKRTAAWELHKLRLLEAFSDGGEIPEAWSGCYAECTLKAAGALIGCGKIDEGFDMLEKAFPRYERWLKIPAGAPMDAGCHDVFGGAKITKWDSEKSTVEIYFEDGRKEWTPYLWLFWQLRGDIFAAMSQWRWFDSVKEDQRFGELYEKAKKLAGK